MEFKGTKGEWRFSEDHLCITTSRIGIVEGSKTICIIKEHPSFDYSGFESQANAKLIAAAPDLLEALQELLNTCPCDPDITSEFWQANQKAKQAIEKALK